MSFLFHLMIFLVFIFGTKVIVNFDNDNVLLFYGFWFFLAYLVYIFHRQKKDIINEQNEIIDKINSNIKKRDELKSKCND